MAISMQLHAGDEIPAYGWQADWRAHCAARTVRHEHTGRNHAVVCRLPEWAFAEQ